MKDCCGSHVVIQRARHRPDQRETIPRSSDYRFGDRIGKPSACSSIGKLEGGAACSVPTLTGVEDYRTPYRFIIPKVAFPHEAGLAHRPKEPPWQIRTAMVQRSMRTFTPAGISTVRSALWPPEGAIEQLSREVGKHARNQQRRPRCEGECGKKNQTSGVALIGV